MAKSRRQNTPLGRQDRLKLNVSFDDALRLAAKKHPMTRSIELKLYKEESDQLILAKSANKEVSLYNIQLQGHAEVNPEDYVVEVYIGSIKTAPFAILSLYQNTFVKNKHIGFFIRQDGISDKPYMLRKEDTKDGNVHLLLKKKNVALDKESTRAGHLVYYYV